VDELAVLAYVLGVPPLYLLLPIDVDEEVDVLPTRREATATALAWLRGDQPLGNARPGRAYETTQLYVRAFEAAGRVYELLGVWDDAGESNEAPRPPSWVELFEATRERVRTYRKELRAAGHPLPPLPIGLAWLDEGGDA
jgi:hypothetical protein